MMTAKELCQEIKKEKINRVIAILKNRQGNFDFDSHWIYSPRYRFENNNQQIRENIEFNIVKDYKEDLVKLGYRINATTKSLIYKVYESKPCFFGLFTKDVEIEKKFIATVLSVSACCGEE